MKATLLANCPITEYLPEMPDTGVAIQLENLSSTAGEARDNFWTNYNSAVVTTVQGISNLPQTLSSIMSQALEAVQESTK